MDFNLDAARNLGPAWDLRLSVNGVPYRVREVTLREYAELARQGPGLSREEDRRILQGLFVGEERPNVELWEDGMVQTAYDAIAAYLREYLQKKRQATHDLLAATMGLQETAAKGTAKADLTSGNR